MSSKTSSCALQVSLKLFCEQFENAAVWTLSFKVRHSPKDALLAWNSFRKAWWHYSKGTLCGIRVIEPHPGGHGAHFHVVVDKFYHKATIERLAATWGFGWFFVQTVKTWKQKDLGRYVSKGLYRYMSKFEVSDSEWTGIRRWATFGEFKGVRVKELVLDGPFQRLYREVRARVGHPLSWQLIRELYVDFRDGRMDAEGFHTGDYLRDRADSGKVVV